MIVRGNLIHFDLIKIKTMSMKNIVLGVSLVVATLAMSGSVLAGESVGMKVVKDAQTGALRAPNAQEFKAMQAAENALNANKKTKNVGMLSGKVNPQAVHMANGGTKIELTEDTLVYSVVQRAEDGSLVQQCVTGADAAEKAMNDKSASATHAHKEHKDDVK
jgi:hypothetical protein